jgi:hypothetical protein
VCSEVRQEKYNRGNGATLRRACMGEVRRMHLLGTSVNTAASVSVYTGGHLFGPRERMRLLGQSPSPEMPLLREQPQERKGKKR